MPKRVRSAAFARDPSHSVPELLLQRCKINLGPALGDQRMRQKVMLAKGRVQRGGVRDQFVDGDRGARSVIVEVGGNLIADSVGIVAVGDGIVMGGDEGLVGFEGRGGHWTFWRSDGSDEG